MKVASTRYTIASSPSWSAYQRKIITLVEQVKEKGAQLLLLPEYAGIEIATERFNSDQALFEAIQSRLDDYLAFYQHLAKAYQLYIQPGTYVVKLSTGSFANRAYFFSPTGKIDFQDKLQLVNDEKRAKLLTQGHVQTLFKTDLGTIGIAICYDSEFPETVRQLTQQGATLILVPSYTPSVHSTMRVYQSCSARAIENQCYVLLSCASGKTQFGNDVEHLSGNPTLFTPIDEGFPTNGCIQQPPEDTSDILVAQLQPELLAATREHGQTHNFMDSLSQKPLSICTIDC